MLSRHVRRFHWAVGLSLLVVCGCGLRAYESKMLTAQARLARFEEEGRLLDQPLVMPTRADEQGNREAVMNLFLRPPRGIRPDPAREAEPRGRPLTTYAPATKGGAGAMLWMELAFAGTEKDFTADVLRWYPSTEQRSTRKRQVRHPEASQATVFETTEFEDEQTFLSVNVWRGDKKQVAIVYGASRGQRGAVSKAVERSLESFAIDQEADQRRQQHAQGTPLKVPEHPGK